MAMECEVPIAPAQSQPIVPTMRNATFSALFAREQTRSSMVNFVFDNAGVELLGSSLHFTGNIYWPCAKVVS